MEGGEGTKKAHEKGRKGGRLLNRKKMVIDDPENNA